MSKRKFGCALSSTAALSMGVFTIFASPSRAHADLTGTVLYPILNGSDSGYSGETAEGLTVGDTRGRGHGAPDTATLWVLPTGSTVNLTPSGFSQASANSTDGTYEIGNGEGTTTGGQTHALLWQGTASMVDLNPAGFTFSIGEGIGGGQEVGYGESPSLTTTDALLWTGTSNVAVDLNAVGSGYSTTIGQGTDGTQQVGYGITDNQDHALLWSGTAASMVDLSPASDGFTYGETSSVSHGQQVGAAAGPSTDGIQAALWDGTADSYVNLDPLAVYDQTYAMSTNGTQQVGYGNGDDGDSALLWSGSGDTMVDLQLLLPAGGTWEQSDAYFIDSAGNIFGTAFGTFDDISGTFAVEWSPVAVPEPASFGLLGAASLLLLRRRPRVAGL